MDKAFLFFFLGQVAIVMMLAYFLCLIPRNDQQKHAPSYQIVIGVLAAFGVMLLIEHGIMYGLGLPSNESVFQDLNQTYSSDSELTGLFFASSALIASLVGLYFGRYVLLVAALVLSPYVIYLTDFPIISLILALGLSGVLGALFRRYTVEHLGTIKLAKLYLFGLVVQIVFLSTSMLTADNWRHVIHLNSLYLLVFFPLIMLAAANLMSKYIFFERNMQIRLQEDFLFKNQFDIGNIGIAITSKAKYWLKVNPCICKMLKYSEKELTRMTWKELTHPEDLEKDLSYFNRMLKGEISEYEIDKRFIAKDGAIVYTHLTVACRFYDNGSMLVIAGFLDITKLKQAEAALQNSKEQLALVLDSSDLGIWDWHINTNEVASNLRSAQIIGCELALLNQKPSLWFKAIIAEDRKRLIKSLLAIRKGQSIHHKIEYRIRSLNGDIRWILDTGKVVEVADTGQPLRMCGTHTDITDLKRAEESLSIAASVYRNSSEAMCVFDYQGKIVNTNPAFSEITGFDADEVIGQHLAVLQKEEQAEHFNLQLEQYLFEKRYWQGELSFQRKNGQTYTAWVTINAIGELDTCDTLNVMLFADVSEKKQAEELIWLQANYDTLTGLPNRRMLLEYIKLQIANCTRDNQGFALLFLDLDFFKEVNDSLGHDMGDSLLVEASQRIKACIRDADLVARIGGDEFTIVLTDFTGPKGVERVTNKILKQLSEPFMLGSEMAYISGSIGITLYPDDALTIDGLLKNADQAMYSAKAHGRNKFNYFTPKMQETALRRMKLIQDLKTAIKMEEFELYYQPIIDFSANASDNITKAEALIRWHHPKLGFISPVDFIPIAEDTGMIVEIGNWVFRQACRQAAQWKQTYGLDIQISINKSPVQFRDERSSVTSWTQYISELNLSPASICVEITEGLLLETESGVGAKLAAFRDVGMQISLDDFGTGYSSLSYLKKFDIDYLKIDKSFVSNLEDNTNDLSLCEAIIVMSHKLGIKVIAEGIETELQRAMLECAGCDYGQGYLFSKPVKAEDFESRYFISSDEFRVKKNRA